jgi:hypothetical protein
MDDQAIADYIADIRAEDPDIEDTFEADRSAWDLDPTDDASRYLRNGELHVSVDTDNTVSWSESSTQAANFYMEVDTTQREGSLNNEFGVLFRYIDADSFYLFSTGSDGYYRFRKSVDNGWETLVERTKSNVINTGEGSQNTLGVLAEGPNIILLINDYIVHRVEDDSFVQGTLALGAGTYDEPGVVVSFDNFAVWLLGGPGDE